jgi:hypothetical protein
MLACHGSIGFHGTWLRSAMLMDVQQSNAMVFNRFCRKTGLPLVGLVALLF